MNTGAKALDSSYVDTFFFFFNDSKRWVDSFLQSIVKCPIESVLQVVWPKHDSRHVKSSLLGSLARRNIVSSISLLI